MKVLVLSCDTGGGHNTCGRAVVEACRKRQIPCGMDDAFRFVSPTLSRCVSYGFDRVYRYTPKLFSAGWRFSEQHPRAFRRKSAAYRFWILGARKLARLIREQGYDTVVCTHMFSGMLITEARNRHGLSLRTCFVATDYTWYPGCGSYDLDVSYIPHEDLIDDYAAIGVPQNRIVASGIPVREAFLSREERGTARRRLGLPEDCRHLMIMGGSMGCGPIAELTALLPKLLPEDCHVSVLCGNNRGLAEELERRCAGDARFHIYGFTDLVPRLMDSADLYLTKPGGISVTEAAHKRLPMVFVNAVAGCETHNLNFFLQRGAAVTAETPEELARTCLALLDDPARLTEMAAAMEPVAQQDPCDTILRQLEGMGLRKRSVV